MNPTEHGLKMAFDPDYETRWEVLIMYRRNRRRELKNMLREICYLTPAYALMVTFLSAITPWGSYIFLLPPVVILIGIAGIYIRDDILFRRRIGI